MANENKCKMKKICFLILFIVLGSCYKETVFRPQIIGKTLELETEKPLIATIKTIPLQGEIEEITVSDSLGYFILPKISSSDWFFLGMEKSKSPGLTSNIEVCLKGYKSDTINFSKFQIKNNKINLGTIYLEKIDNISPK